MMNPAEFANIAQAEDRFWWYRGMRRITFAMLDAEVRRAPVRDVLEAGCGTGYFSRELERRYHWRMFPLDLGEEGLRYAKRFGLRRLVQGDVCRLPYADARFDAVVSMDVIIHLERGREHEPVREFARVLKPGGLLALRVAALDILSSRHSRFAHERQRFTRGQLLDLAGSCGLVPIRVTYANSLLFPVALFKFRLWEPLTRAKPASGVRPVPRWLDSLLYAPLAVEALCLARGARFPIGQSLILLARKPIPQNTSDRAARYERGAVREIS